MKNPAFNKNNAYRAFFNSQLSNIYYYTYNYKKSIYHAILAERQINNMQDSLQQRAFFLLNYVLANIYNKIGKNAEAYKRYMKLSFIAESSININDKAQANNIIGLLLYGQNKFKKSRDYFKNAVLVGKREKNPPYSDFRLQEYYDNIALTFYKNKLYDSALIYLDTAKMYYDKLYPTKFLSNYSISIAEAVIINNKSKVYAALGNWEKAIILANNAIEIYKNQSKLPDEVKFVYLDLANIYCKIGKYNTAQEYLGKLKINIDKQDINFQLSYLNVLSQIEEQLGNYKSSLNIIRMYNNINDSIKKDYIDNNFYQILADYTIKQFDREIEDIKSKEKLSSLEKKRSDLVTLFSSVFLLIAIIIVIIIMYNYNKQKKFNIIIENANKELIEFNQIQHKLIEEKNDIIGIVAHDLKSPLNSMEGLLMILEDSIAKNNLTETQKIIDFLKKSNHYLNSVTDDLVEATLLDNENYELTKEKVDLVIIMKQLIEMFENEFNQKKLNLHLNLPEYELKIKANKEKLNRAVVNLISNAIKFTPDSGHIEISLKEINNNAKIIIKDSGIGIPKPILKYLFNKFSKAGRKGIRGEKSNGLGMYISARIIELHGGKIKVESEENNGTQLEISIPACS